MNATAAMVLCFFCQAGDITFEKSWPEALKKGKEKNGLVLLYFSNDGVKDCKRFAEETLTKPAVAAAFKGFVVARIDPEGPDEDNFLWQKHGSPGLPILFIYDGDGAQLASVLHLGAEYVTATLGAAPRVYRDKISPGRAALAKNPEDIDALRGLGEAFAALENDAAAGENFTKAIDLLEKKGDSNGAIELMQKMFEAFMEKKWYKALKPVVKRLSDIDPLNRSGLGAKAAWVEGLAACEERKWQDAIDVLKPACEKYTDVDFLDKMMFSLASAYMYSKDKDTALKVFEEIVAKFPESETANIAKIQVDKLKR